MDEVIDKFLDANSSNTIWISTCSAVFQGRLTFKFDSDKGGYITLTDCTIISNPNNPQIERFSLLTKEIIGWGVN